MRLDIEEILKYACFVILGYFIAMIFTRMCSCGNRFRVGIPVGVGGVGGGAVGPAPDDMEYELMDVDEMMRLLESDGYLLPSLVPDDMSDRSSNLQEIRSLIGKANTLAKEHKSGTSDKVFLIFEEEEEEGKPNYRMKYGPRGERHYMFEGDIPLTFRGPILESETLMIKELNLKLQE